MLINPADPFSKSLTEQTQAAAKTIGIGVHVVSARKVEELARAFATMAEHRDEGVIVQAIFTTSFGQIAQLAQRRICGLCGRAFAIVPPGEPEREQDNLCVECLRLPPAPAEESPA